jgi:flagellar hook protein FlgE
MFNALSGLVASAQKLQNSANNLANLKDFSPGINKVTVGDTPESRPDVDSTETSKVNISKEMVNQMAAQVAFTTNAGLTVIADETIGTILDIKS